jgi:hypothetical protein
MAEFIVNPRRAPRAPARCRAAVVSTQGWFDAETEDIGSMGCQLVSPKQVRKGDIVQLHVTNEKVEQPLKASGRVAWVSPQAPYRVGICFDEAARPGAARWFDLLVAAYPGLGGYRRVPDRIRADATVYLGPPPRFLVDFTADEAMLLRAIASGARIDELTARLRDQWPAAQRALFSLIARQVVTFQRGQAVHPDSWKKILSDVEASLAVEELGKEVPALKSAPPPPPPMEAYRPAHATAPASDDIPLATPVPSARAALRGSDTWAAPAHDPSPVLDLPSGGAAAPLELERPAPGAPPRGVPPHPAALGTARPAHEADFSGAGVGWRKTRTRSAEAQATYDRAVEELRVGSVNGAIALLRRALQLAPGDAEIAQALGKLAFKKDRPGSP